MRLGHAVASENGTITGTAGNQNGRELKFQDWYAREKGWTHVFRAKDKATREKIALACEAGVRNQKIGYDQNQRTTLYEEAKKVNFDLSKISKACETDCSAFVAVCLNAAGISVSKDMYTGNEADVLKKTGAFTTYTAEKYLVTDENLMRGDILLGKGHTAICLGKKEQEPAKENATLQTSKEVVQSATKEKGRVRVQVCACKNLTTAQHYAKILSDRGYKPDIVFENDYYRVIALYAETTKEANKYVPAIQSIGFSCWVYTK